jgi:DNA-binding response OmpR family regulator
MLMAATAKETGPPEIEARKCHCCPCCVDIARLRIRQLHPEEDFIEVKIGEVTISSLGKITPYMLSRSLTSQERRVLTVLGMAYPEPASREEINTELFLVNPGSRALDTYLSRMRRKLKEWGLTVLRLQSYGYLLEIYEPNPEDEEGDAP